MLCQKCGKKIIIKRTLLTLFDNRYEYLCNKCYKEYPIKLNVEHVLLEEHKAIILSLFDRKHFIDYNYFINEYQKIFFSYLKRYEYHVLFLDYLSLTDSSLEALDIISKLMDKDLIVITFFLKK